MAKDSNVKMMLPQPVESGLKKLGQNLHIARKRREESLAVFSRRLQVSIPTLRKMEAGDPSVSVAAYATAIWLVGQIDALANIANPQDDEVALMREIGKKIKKPLVTTR